MSTAAASLWRWLRSTMAASWKASMAAEPFRDCARPTSRSRSAAKSPCEAMISAYPLGVSSESRPEAIAALKSCPAWSQSPALERRIRALSLSSVAFSGPSAWPAARLSVLAARRHACSSVVGGEYPGSGVSPASTAGTSSEFASSSSSSDGASSSRICVGAFKSSAPSAGSLHTSVSSSAMRSGAGCSAEGL